MDWRRPESYVCEEGDEGIPSLADGDSSTAVAVILRRAGVQASLAHVHPGAILRRNWATPLRVAMKIGLTERITVLPPSLIVLLTPTTGFLRPPAALDHTGTICHDGPPERVRPGPGLLTPPGHSLRPFYLLRVSAQNYALL